MRRGEFELIASFVRRLKLPKKIIPKGPGDDCAVVRVGRETLLLTTDMLVERVHFHRDWMSPEQIGSKAMRVNLSDIAAMGGVPLFALVSLGLPPWARGRTAERLFSGIRKSAEREGVIVAGGDTNSSRELIVNVAIIGRPGPRVLLRSGARPGDRLYVTGSLGGSALGLAALSRGKRSGYESFIRRHADPPSRLKVGRALARMTGVHALMDLSDGLAGDLPHLLKASGVGAEVRLRDLPLATGLGTAASRLGCDPVALAACGGEDYELLFTAAPRVKIPREIAGVRVTNLGKILPGSAGLHWLGGNGVVKTTDTAFRGFRHF